MKSLFDRFRQECGRRISGENNRILVAEDHSDLAEVIAKILARCGFVVKIVQDGREVPATAKAFLPHFILLDIRLPGLGGYEVARRLRNDATLKGTIIIGISAYRPIPQPRHQVNACFDHYLLKPFDTEKLLSLLRPV